MFGKRPLCCRWEAEGGAGDPFGFRLQTGLVLGWMPQCQESAHETASHGVVNGLCHKQTRGNAWGDISCWPLRRLRTPAYCNHEDRFSSCNGLLLSGHAAWELASAELPDSGFFFTRLGFRVKFRRNGVCSGHLAAGFVRGGVSHAQCDSTRMIPHFRCAELLTIAFAAAHSTLTRHAAWKRSVTKLQ